jgi:hypothetical protein
MKVRVPYLAIPPLTLTSAQVFRSNRNRRSTGATRGPIYNPFMVLEELNATINVIRASLPDPREITESEDVDEEPPSDHTSLTEFFDFDAFERQSTEGGIESGDAIETLDRLVSLLTEI